jgi:hypothetical protein
MFMPNFPTDSFDPLTRTLFLDFIVIPFVAAHLIAEDSNESPETAWELMVRTGDYGVTLHGDVENDSELEEIFESNARASRKEHASGLSPGNVVRS